MAVEIQPLCNLQKMENLLSLRGVIGFSDHEECGEINQEVIDDVCERATYELVGYLHPVYEIAGLSDSPLACHWATVLAIFHLSKTRGNPTPDSLYEDYERIFGENGLVQQARRGSFILPCATRTSNDAPTWSNMRVDRRFRNEKVRVVKETSSPVASTIEQDAAPISGRR